MSLALAWVALAIYVATLDRLAPEPAAARTPPATSAMLEVAARGDEFGNGDKLARRRIIGYSDAHRLSKPISEGGNIRGHAVRGAAARASSG